MLQDTLVVRTRPGKAFIGVAVGLALSVAGAAHGATFYSFEDSGNGDWSPAISNVPSGGGVLGVASADGVRHAEVINIPDGSGFPGYGDGSYSCFGITCAAKLYTGDFFQSIAVYINTALSSGGSAAINNAFWIDMSPTNATTGLDFGGEHNFRISTFGGTASVYVDGAVAPMTTLSTSGWYQFEFTYEKGAAATDPTMTDAFVKDMSGATLGSVLNISNPGLLSGDLGAEGYVWLTNQINGYSSDRLAIDCVQSGLGSTPVACVEGQAVPEPATLALLGLGLAGLGFGRRKRA